MAVFLKKYRNDLLLILGLIVAALGLFLWIHASQKEGTYAKIEENGVLIDLLDLSQPLEKRYETAEGGWNQVVVGDEIISVTEASCPDKLCVHQGSKSSMGETIICLPNRFVVTIIGNDEAREVEEQLIGNDEAREVEGQLK